MRLSCALLLAVAIFIAGSPDSIVATGNDIPTTISKIGTSSLVHSATTSENDQPVHRALRTGKVTEDDEVEEERMKQLIRQLSDLTDDGYNTAVRLKRNKSLPGFTEKEKLERLTKDQDLRVRAIEYFATVEKLDPADAVKVWGVSKRFKEMSMAELKIDPHYLFWRQYKHYWDSLH